MRGVSSRILKTCADHRRELYCMQERLHTSEWAAVCVAALGTIGIGATSADEAAGDKSQEASTARIVGVLGLLCIAVLADSFLRYQRTLLDKRAAKASKPSASSYGLQVSTMCKAFHMCMWVIPQESLKFAYVAPRQGSETETNLSDRAPAHSQQIQAHHTTRES